jgi:hypothetical protein
MRGGKETERVEETGRWAGGARGGEELYEPMLIIDEQN